MKSEFTIIIAILLLALSNLVSATEDSIARPVSISSQQIEQVLSSDIEDTSLIEKASNKTTRTGRNPQTGKEIKIAAGNSGGLIDSMVDKLDDAQLDGITARATITIDGDVYHTNVKFNVIELPDIISSSEYRCGVSRDDVIVCQVTPYDDDESSRGVDPTLFCWGNNELRECPNEEIQTSRGGGAGKVSIQDIKIESSTGADGPESSIEAYYQGVSTQSIDSDDDMLELSYVWRLNGEYMSSGDNGTPSETLSLSFGKIEIKYSADNGGSGGTILIEVPEMRVYQNSLVFTEISFLDLARSVDGRVCGVTDHFLLGEDCDDHDPRITPYSKADAKKALDGFTRAIDNIKSSLERCGDDVCRQVRANADVRKRLVERAIADVGNTPPVVSEVRGIVEEDIAALERCRTDACRDVLSQERELLRAIDGFIAMASASGDTIWPHDWSKNISEFSYASENGDDGDGIPDYWVDALDLDSDNDGIPDFRDPDDDGDGILTRDEPLRYPVHRDVALSRGFITDTTGSMGGTINTVRRARPREWSEDDRESIGEYVRSIARPEGEDLALSIAYQASNNERVREVRFNEETNEVEVEHEEEVRLLGFIPVQARARTIIDSEMNERTEYPWWSFLATKENKVRFKAGADISKSVN